MSCRVWQQVSGHKEKQTTLYGIVLGKTVKSSKKSIINISNLKLLLLVFVSMCNVLWRFGYQRAFLNWPVVMVV